MDPRMAAELQKRVQGKPEQKKLEILVGDFIKQELPYFDVCISNTPYQVSNARLQNSARADRASDRFRHPWYSSCCRIVRCREYAYSCSSVNLRFG